jgi:hypothetical protein
VGPVTDAYTYATVMEAAIEAGLIPANAKEAPARKALHGLINEALDQQVGVIDDAIASDGPAIVAWLRAEGAKAREEQP